MRDVRTGFNYLNTHDGFRARLGSRYRIYAQFATGVRAVKLAGLVVVSSAD